MSYSPASSSEPTSTSFHHLLEMIKDELSDAVGTDARHTTVARCEDFSQFLGALRGRVHQVVQVGDL